jgi:Fe-S oxidoreductase
MARMKVEFLYHYRKRHGYRLKDRVVGHLPRVAPYARVLAPLLNALAKVPVAKRALGFSARRSLPRWSAAPFRESSAAAGDVVLFVDTFDRYFEPEIARAARRVLEAAGYRVIIPQVRGRALCCGRTYLSSGMLDQARAEIERTHAVLGEYVERGIPIVGLEPSCLLTMRDEFVALLGPRAGALARSALLFEEFLTRERTASRLALPLRPVRYRRALVHGHCHQKAFGAFASVEQILRLIPELTVETIESSCCGMAGTFGYDDEHLEVSLKMAERSLLPAVRNAGGDTVIVADGTSCRHQIRDGAARESMHVARLLEEALVR